MRALQTRGYALAVATLVLEVLLAFGLFSETYLGLFAMMAMVLVGVAWLPAGWLIFAEARDGEPTLWTYLIAGACGITGGLCLLLLVKWTLVGLAVR